MSETITAPSRLIRPARPTGGALAPPARRTLTWGFAVLLSVYLGLSGGGYDIVVRSEIGLLVWWFVLLGALVGALPYARIPRVGWVATGLLAGFLLWTWIGLSWTSSHELTLDELCRISTYLGIFLVGLCMLTPELTRPLLNGLGCGIAAVSIVAIMSKLTPSLFPTSAAGNSFYATARLSYPFGYADGVGEYAALGLPLVLYIATGARTLAGRALGTAALAPVLLCLALTVSRGGILAACVGAVAFFALAPNRIPRLPTLVIAGAAIALLMAALLHRPALRDQISAAPAHQRHTMLLLLCVAVAGSALVQLIFVLVARHLTRPRWLRVSRRGAQGMTAAVVLAAVAVVIVGLTAGTAGHLWHDFKQWQPETQSNQYFRLLSLAGSHRYQYWQIAWSAFTGSPLHGIGSGTFRLYWFQHTTHAEYILNAHSLWFETLAETGIVGWLLLAGFFGLTVVSGAVRALRAGAEQRLTLATGTAGVLAFCSAAAFDWDWQIGVIPMVTMLLAAVALSGSARASEPSATPDPPARRAWWSGLAHPRLLIVPGAALAIILIAIPLASTVAVRASQAAVARSDDAARLGRQAAARADLRRALTDADTARAIEPGAASPYLQRALVLEKANDISGATRAIRQAIAREPTYYFLWSTASRIATEAGHPRRALRDWNHARFLYPTSEYFGG